MSDRAPADLEFGTFSDEPPWLIEPDQLVWRRRANTIRSTVRRDVPGLIRPRRFPPGRRVLTVSWQLGRALAGWWVTDKRHGGARSRASISRRLRVAAERLGPTYIKLGQIISSGRGVFPDELVEEFARCRDQVPAEPFDAVKRVIEDDLGCHLSAVFSSIDETPLAAASIAQVHRATLLDGTEVVVKVQRPGIGRQVSQDLAVMAWLAPFLIGRIPIAALANPPALVEVFANTITEELDFRLEADSMLDVAASFAELGQRGYVVPRPHPELVTRRVLVMERLSGFAFDDLSSMQAAGIDTHEILRRGMIGFLEGCLIHGVFHGDLHGGNLFVMPDGRTALLDFGITGRLSDERRLAFLRLLMGGTMNDVRIQLQALCELGALPLDTDIDAVIVDLGLDKPPIDPTTLSQEELIDELQRTMKLLLGYGARLPRELMLFVKNLVFLEGAIATLAPDIDLIGEIAHVATHFATTHGPQIAAQIGMNPAEYKVDLSGVRDAFGVDQDASGVTYRELQERRDLIRERLRGRQ